MDEAAVYTIHGWCNRMLQQHAFDSGNLFKQEVNNDDQELLNEVVRDYWRTFFYPLTEAQCLAVYKLAHTPEELAKVIKPLLSEIEALGLEDDEGEIGDAFKDWEAWEQERCELEYQARLSWHENKQDIEQRLKAAVENRWLNGNQYRQATFGNKLEALLAWVQGELPLGIIELEKFGQQKLTEGLVKAHQDKADQLQHPTFLAIDNLIEHTSQESDIGKKLKLHALSWIRNRYDKVKLGAAHMTFDDMLTRLDKALQGDHGEQLANLIRQQYPVALFDEFQDTDPIQYRILSTLYPAYGDTDLACFMIGDPKQAIYSFRGADIFTYLKAHHATSGQHYTLGTNFRSTTALVDAVNQVFLQADRQAEGAFRFKAENDNPLPFQQAEAKGRDDEWVVGDQPAPALTVWHWETSETIGMPNYRETMAEVTASEIVRLLNKSTQGNTGFKTQSGEIKPIQPSDIAILVRNGTEAKAMRSALANRRLRSIYLSERDSIYATREAADLLHWLEAIADPRNERKVRTALSTATIGWPYQTLQQLTQDESGWERQLERFLGYHDRWQLDGILPMLRQMINDYALHARLSENNGGERCLTNLLHLAELLQQASGKLEGKQALLRHLAEEISSTDSANEENVIRLESDANLIKVITVHKSKGLEYPLVFLPFICSFREANNRNSSYYRYHDANQHLCIDFDKLDENKSTSDKERLQEDIRLLYVAMTRAQTACWLGIAPIKSGNTKACQLEKSGMGYVLGWQAGMPSGALSGQLAQLKGDCDTIAVTALPKSSTNWHSPIEQQEQLDLPRTSTASIADHWWIASYSALQTEKKPSFQINALTDTKEPETAQDDKRNDETDTTAGALTKTLSGIHSLPRGASTGILVHELMEQCAYYGFQAVQSSPEIRGQLIGKIFNHDTWENKHDIISTALSQWLRMPLLEDANVSLCDLKASQYQAEMEFLLGADNVDVESLDRLVTQHTFAAKPRPRLLQAQVHGLLKGFIDLVFVYNQQYYIADYKFNALGDDDTAYSQETLEAVMLDKRYDLQYALYLLALHRLLKNRLGTDYDYDKHVGGALYLFLRGINTPTCGRVLDKPPRSLIDGLDRLFSSLSINGITTKGKRS
jgi:exodeoxyribonuclease V beta subunit